MMCCAVLTNQCLHQFGLLFQVLVRSGQLSLQSRDEPIRVTRPTARQVVYNGMVCQIDASE